MLKVGDPAPEFTLVDEAGERHRLSDYRGKNPVVLIFYPMNQSAVCTAQLCEVRDAYADLKAAGAVIFGVNSAGEESHRSFAQRHSFPFRLLIDEGRQVAKQYQTILGWGKLSITNRSVYVIGKDGKVLFARMGKPKPQEMLAAIQAAK
jgi:peroxiredoxin Q/BCP